MSCRKLFESLVVSYQAVLEKLQIRKDVMMTGTTNPCLAMGNPRKNLIYKEEKKQVHNFFSCRRLCESLVVFLSIG